MKRYQVTFQPSGRELFVPEGTTVKDALNSARLDLDFPCGGGGKCGKCRVQVLNGADLPTAAEKKHLEEKEMEQGFRLACMTPINADLVVALPYDKVPEHKILLTTAERDVNIEPHLLKTYVEVPAPSIRDQRPDWERLRTSLAEKGPRREDLEISLALLRALPQTLRTAKYHVTAISDEHELLGLEQNDTTRNMLGIAFDIGTTTIVGYLIDLCSGMELSIVSALNPQTKYGADVITRITYASREKGGLEKLHAAVVAALNRLIGEAADKAGARPEDIYAITIVGNTCMHHLFLGIDPTNLALAPYLPVTGNALTLSSQELGIEINEAGMIYVLPNIAGFVGADTVAVLLATEIDWSEGVKLVIDIGTNGEIALGSREKLLACSAAAGPAFEGAQISSGMRGAVGAIDHVRFGESLEYSVIGSGKPQGICGSGLLDAVAGLLELGVIDKKGRILSPEQLENPQAARFKNNIMKHEGANAFLLVDESATTHSRPILITQRDVRELQLAKGAMATGIRVLIEKFGIEATAITEVLLAGAFGNYLNPHSACVIGLIPPELEAKVKMVGNAAGTGAKLALLSRSEYRRAAAIADFVEYVELSAYANFTTIFARSMVFPEPGHSSSHFSSHKGCGIRN